MPSRGAENALLHMRENILLGQRFIGDATYDQFRDDAMMFYAVTRCLEIISEASRRLPDDLRARHPEIPWREMAAAGNIYRHDYEDVQQRRVWKTVQERFAALLAVVEQELDSIS